MKALVIVTASVVAMLAACGSPLSSAGVSCSTDGDCAAGLSCLDLASNAGSACRTLTTLCSKPCRTDGDCAAVGPGFKCYPTCDAKGTCALVQ